MSQARNTDSHIVKGIFKDTFIVQMVSSLMLIAGMVVDGAVTGSCLGTDSLAAYGFTVPLITIVTACGNAIGVGFSTVLGKDMGRGDLEGAKRHLFSALTVFTAFFVVASLVIFFMSTPVAHALGARGEIAEKVVQYLNGYFPTVPALIFVISVVPVLQIDGDRRSVFLSILIMTALNIAFDLLNGFVLHKGLFGMAIATTASTYAGLVVVAIHFVGKKCMLKLKPCAIDFKCVGSILRYGLPGAIYMSGRAVMIGLVNNLLSGMADTATVAVYTGLNSAFNICLCPGTGIGSTVTMLTGVFSGERDRSALRTIVSSGVKLSIIMNSVLSIIFILLAEPMMRLFIKDPSISMDFAATAFMIVVPSMIFYSINATFRSYYQAMSINKITYTYVILDSLVCNFVAAFILGKVFGVTGVWIGLLVGGVFTLAIMMLLVKLAGNKEKRPSDSILLLPGEFYTDMPQIVLNIDDEVGVQDASQRVMGFVTENGDSKGTALKLGIAVEEMVGNVVRYGFADGKKHHIELKLVASQDMWNLRVRDDCDVFDPTGYLESFESDDELAHIGIRMVSRLVDDMKYMSTLKTNNLALSIRRRI